MANPQTKPEAKKTEREKNGAGLLARLLGRGASGGAAGAGAFGGAGGAGASGGLGGLLGGGLLATKAGLLAAILVGTTVAGGIGLAGYHLLASGPERPAGENLQLFATKPKETPVPVDPPVPEDGSSASLKYFAEANAVPGSPDAPQNAAEAAQAAASGAAASASDAATGPAPANSVSADNGVSKNLLKNGKFGKLTGTADSVGRGGVAGSAGPAAAGKPGDVSALAAAAAARAGAPGAMRNGLASAGSARSLAGRRLGSRNAFGQAFGAMRDNQSAASSAGGGATYDGSAAAGGNIGANGTPIGASGVTDGSAAAQAKSLPGPATTDPNLAPPPTPSAVQKAPWQDAIHTAQLLIGLAVALMLAAKLLSKTGYGHIVAMVIAAVVAGIGAMVIALGAQIANGQYGQKLQGGVLAAAGVGLMIAAAATAFGGDSKNPNADGLNTTGATDADAAGSGASGAGSAGGSAGSDSSMLANVNPFVLIGGGLGLIGLCGSMMAPTQKYPSGTFKNGNPPDTHFLGYRQSPSETALKKMVA